MAKLDEDLSRLSMDDDSSNKFGRRDKFQKELEIYRPGSGPLKRSGSSRQDSENDDKRSVFTGFGRELDSTKKSDFIPNKHFENPNRKKENFPRSQSKMNGFATDNYGTFNLRRKQQKKTQAFYEPPNEWSSDKRPDRPRVNFVNPDDSKGNEDGNWRAHKAHKVVSISKVVKNNEEKPILEKHSGPNKAPETTSNIVTNIRINTAPVQNIPEKGPGFVNRKREEKKGVSKTIPSTFLISYEKMPPRFRKKFCDDNHVTMEEIESYLTNGLLSQDDHNKQHGSYQSRSHTLPPKSGKGRFIEPQKHHEQVFYRTNSNQQLPKTEVRRVQSITNNSNESNRRSINLPTKMHNSYEESKTIDSHTRDDTVDNISVNMKQSLESAVILPSGTINWVEEVERAENMSKVAEDTKKKKLKG